MIQLIGLASEEIIVALRRLPRYLGWGRLHSFIRFVGGIFPQGLTPDRSFSWGAVVWPYMAGANSRVRGVDSMLRLEGWSRVRCAYPGYLFAA